MEKGSTMSISSLSRLINASPTPRAKLRDWRSRHPLHRSANAKGLTTQAANLHALPQLVSNQLGKLLGMTSQEPGKFRFKTSGILVKRDYSSFCLLDCQLKPQDFKERTTMASAAAVEKVQDTPVNRWGPHSLLTDFRTPFFGPDSRG